MISTDLPIRASAGAGGGTGAAVVKEAPNHLATEFGKAINAAMLERRSPYGDADWYHKAVLAHAH
jgi:hypothetical protein